MCVHITESTTAVALLLTDEGQQCKNPWVLESDMGRLRQELARDKILA
jgi:hypothetical protein